MLIKTYTPYTNLQVCIQQTQYSCQDMFCVFTPTKIKLLAGNLQHVCDVKSTTHGFLLRSEALYNNNYTSVLSSLLGAHMPPNRLHPSPLCLLHHPILVQPALSTNCRVCGVVVAVCYRYVNKNHHPPPGMSLLDVSGSYGRSTVSSTYVYPT